MTHHSNTWISLSVLPQHGLHAVCSVAEVSSSLVYPGFKHHGENSLDDLIIWLAFILGKDFSIGCLVLLTLVLEEPESTLFLYLIEVVVRVELFFKEKLGTDIAGTADSLREDWFNNDWTSRVGEDEWTCQEGAIERRDQNDVWLEIRQLLSSFCTLNRKWNTS